MARRQFKHNLKVGQRVKFYRTHDKATPLEGTISSISENDDEDLVTVQTVAGNGSISRREEADAADVSVLDDRPAGQSQANTQTAPASGTLRPIG
ncbi:MAG TPA: hypothetical protein VJX23_02955 [Candidatus Binataceae bacterium]|nr:hypothetical protein [Candidatus Binataceae bacterium]